MSESKSHIPPSRNHSAKNLGLQIPPPSEHDWRSGKWRALDAWRAGALDAMRVDQCAVLM